MVLYILITRIPNLAVRTFLADMLGVQSQDTVLVDNASEAINDILRNFEPPLSADEYIIDLSTAYTPFEGFYAWLGERLGVKTITIPIMWPLTGDDSFTVPVANFLANNASTINIRCAVFSHISAYPSVLLPVAALTALFHQYNIPVIIDGAHALVTSDVYTLANPGYSYPH